MFAFSKSVCQKMQNSSFSRTLLLIQCWSRFWFITQYYC